MDVPGRLSQYLSALQDTSAAATATTSATHRGRDLLDAAGAEGELRSLPGSVSESCPRTATAATGDTGVTGATGAAARRQREIGSPSRARYFNGFNGVSPFGFVECSGS